MFHLKMASNIKSLIPFFISFSHLFLMLILFLLCPKFLSFLAQVPSSIDL